MKLNLTKDKCHYLFTQTCVIRDPFLTHLRGSYFKPHIHAEKSLGRYFPTDAL